MKRSGPKFAAASIEAGLVRIGHTGTERGVVQLKAARFVDRDVVHPEGRECLKVLFVLEGVEATKCTEMTAYLYGQDIEAIRKALQMPSTATGEPVLSGD
jgi:hypothetical protein